MSPKLTSKLHTHSLAKLSHPEKASRPNAPRLYIEIHTAYAKLPDPFARLNTICQLVPPHNTNLEDRHWQALQQPFQILYNVPKTLVSCQGHTTNYRNELNSSRNHGSIDV